MLLRKTVEYFQYFLTRRQIFLDPGSYRTSHMKKTRGTLIITSLISLLVTIGVSGTITKAQPQRPTITNADVLEMARIGLGEALIIAKIKKSYCKCDTSTPAIAKLKAAKITDNVILAMIETSGESDTGFTNTVINVPAPASTKPVEKAPPAQSSADPGPAALKSISEPGIYLFENGEMKTIEASVFSGGKINPLLSTLTYGIKKAKWRAKVRGRSANLQTSSVQPVFYFVFNPEYKNSGATMAGLFWGMPATSPNEFLMVQMNVKEASREAVLGEYGAWTGTSMGARDKDIREYSFEKVRTGIYKVVPKNQLTPGEYCFYYAGNVTGIGFAGGKVFDFSVR